MGGGLSGAYDPHDALVFGIQICVNDDEDGDWSDHADGVPSLFALLESIGEDDVQWVCPNMHRKIE